MRKEINIQLIKTITGPVLHEKKNIVRAHLILNINNKFTIISIPNA